MIPQLLQPFFHTEFSGGFLMGYHKFFVDTLLFLEHIGFTMLYFVRSFLFIK